MRTPPYYSVYTGYVDLLLLLMNRVHILYCSYINEVGKHQCTS